jgi:hypothetical protein
MGPGLTGNLVRARAKAIFYELDKDGSGGLTPNELQAWFARYCECKCACACMCACVWYGLRCRDVSCSGLVRTCRIFANVLACFVLMSNFCAVLGVQSRCEFDNKRCAIHYARPSRRPGKGHPAAGVPTARVYCISNQVLRSGKFKVRLCSSVFLHGLYLSFADKHAPERVRERQKFY